ncbi:MAG: PDZ domain-containing protein [Planctomycetota bacterium]
MAALLPVLVLALQVGSGPEPAAEATQAPASRPALSLPGLQSLSREITALRRSADYRGTLSYGRRSRPVPVLHLGDALLAAPRIDGLEAGTEGSLRLDDKHYRVRFLGSDGRFADYWILRDRAHIKAPPAPRFYDPKLRDELGDLVLVIEDRSARLDLLADWQFRMPPMRDSSRQRGGLARWRSGVFTRISDERVQEGATVLALDGSLVGMVLPLDFSAMARRRPTTPPTTPPATPTKEGEEGADRAGSQALREPARTTGQERSMTPFQLVVDPRFLLSQARTLTDKELPQASPSLGIRLLPASRDGTVEGLQVLDLWEGGPSQRAGARPGDRWLAIDGKPLSRLDQVRAALEALTPAGRIEVRYQRGEAEAAVLVIRPD